MTTSSTPFTNARIVNTLTGGPLLTLMLAMEGMEAPGDPTKTWEVFKRFAQVPSQSTHDVVGFQVELSQDGEDPLLSCSWVRQLTDDASDPGYEATRAIQLEYGFTDAIHDVPDDLDLWSDEFASLQEFFEKVEAQPQFRFLLENSASYSGVYQEELDQLA